jgi:cytochrome c oxidase assembly factor CtaG
MIARGRPRLSKPGYALLVIGLLAFLGGPDLIGSISDLRAGPSPTTRMRLEVVTPADGQVIASREVPVGLQLLEPSGAGWTPMMRLSPSTGHIHIAVDGRVTSMAWSPSTAVQVPPGRHVVTVEFVAGDHRPFSPRVLVTRQITIQSPAAVRPGAGAGAGPRAAVAPAARSASVTLSWRDWNWDPAILAVLAFSIAGYHWVARRFPPRRWQAIYFSGGTLSLAAALVSPIDAGSEYLFTIHMVQHMLLLLVAAPLLALAVPPAFLGRLYGIPPVARVLRAVWSPVPAVVLFNGILVFWHLPFAYDATLAVRGVHVLEHLSFLAAGIVFWGVIVSPVPKLVRASWGLRLALVVAADLVNFLVGFTLAFAGHPFYRHYVDVPRLWGLSPLDDLRLGGGLMWVMGQMMYAIPLLLLISVFLRREDTRGSHPNAAAATPTIR